MTTANHIENVLQGLGAECSYHMSQPRKVHLKASKETKTVVCKNRHACKKNKKKQKNTDMYTLYLSEVPGSLVSVGKLVHPSSAKNPATK